MTGTLEPFALDLERPLSTAAGTVDRREGFLVTVDVNGERGVGEATPLSGWTESLADCRRALERALDRLDSGRTDAEAALDALDPGETPAARHGLALAILDARSRAADRPLYRELGGEERVESVPVNATIGDGTTIETLSTAETATERGYRCLKVKVGARPLAEDVDRLRAIRDARPGIELRADANGAWDRETAREALHAFAGLDVAYVEQPLPPRRLDTHADLRGGSVGVALDETLAEYDPVTVLDAGAADVLVLKPMALGGPDRARAVAMRARAVGATPVVTTTVDAAVARSGAVHVAASVPDIAACGLATADRLRSDLLADVAPVSQGRVTVPQSPGVVPGYPPRLDGMEDDRDV